MSRPTLPYRKPKEYVPPYEYCDRWCERCQIDKACCMVYQSTTDAELEAMCEGRDSSGSEFTARHVQESLEDALALLEEMAEEEGIQVRPSGRPSGRRSARLPAAGKEEEPVRPPLLEKTLAYCGDLFKFLEENDGEFRAVGLEEEGVLQALYWYGAMPGPKIGRLVGDPPPADAELRKYLEGTEILTAQVAHRALRETERGLLEVIRLVPRLTDPAIDLLARGKALRDILEDSWLSKSCDWLEPVEDGPWWGPIEDSSEALRRLRDVRQKRKARGKGKGTEEVGRRT